jgi:hypothetical protein
MVNGAEPQLLGQSLVETFSGGTSRKSKAYWFVLFAVWIVSIAYAAGILQRGWMAHEDGAFAESAERVMNGELPHKDFDDVYTGGLAFLDALSFREFGSNLTSMRLVLFAFFAVWIPALYYVASRFVSPYSAGLITAVGVVWSLPNHPAPMPSWYNLFFAIFGTAALLRYIEVNSRKWLFAAGLCGGLSILAKIAGLYFIAAVILFLIFREQTHAKIQQGNLVPRAYLYIAAVTAGLIGFVSFLTLLLLKVPGVADVIQFGVPSYALVLLLLRREFAGIPGSDRQRFASLMQMIWPFAAGVSIPVLSFILPYCLSGSLKALFNGVLILPTKRLTFAALAAPGTSATVAVMIFLFLIVFILAASGWKRQLWGAVMAVGLATVIWISLKFAPAYEFAWFTLAISIPVTIVQGAAELGSSPFAQRLTPLRQERLTVLLCVAALSTMIQFPFSAAFYFCFVAPLALLAATALFSAMERSPRFLMGTLLVFYLIFGVLRLTPGFNPIRQNERLGLPRAGGIRMFPEDTKLYAELIPLVQAHASGRYIYATPDCPEIYFLSGLNNPTRTLFDFFDDPKGRTERILSVLDRYKINVVTLNDDTQFSPPVEPTLRNFLETRFPHSKRVGKFEVRWAQ